MLVQQRPLDPGALAPAAARRPRRGRTPGRTGRGRCARPPSGSSAPPGDRDSPPNMRWSTKRSSGSPSAKPEQHPGVGHHGRRRPGPAGTGRSSPGGPATASPSVSGSQRYLPRRRGSAKVRPASEAAKSSAPGQVPTDRPGVQHLHRGDPAAGDPGGQTAADDLDLGQLRHQVSERRRGRCRASALEGREGHGRGVLLGLLLVAAGTGAVALVVDLRPWPRRTWRGPVRTPPPRTPARRGRRPSAISCRLVFQSSPAPRVATSAIRPSNRWCTKTRAASMPCCRKTAPITASMVSARIEDLSRPPVLSSPRPRWITAPRSSSRATSASARELTTAARSLASCPSDRSG